MAKPPPEPLYTFRGSMSPVHCLLPLIQDDVELLYAGTNEGNVHVWDLKSKREVTKHDVGGEACLSILYKNCLFITQQKGDSIKFWQENNFHWTLQKIIINEYCGFCNMCMLNDLIFLPDNDSKIIIYDFNKNKEILVEGKKELGQVMCMKSVESLEGLLVAYEAGDIYLWNKKLELISKNKFFSDCPMALDYCDVTGEGIIGTVTKTFYKFKVDQKSGQLTKVSEADITNAGVGCVAVDDGGKLCALGCWDGRVRYFSMKSLKLLAALQHHSASLHSILFIKQKLSFCGSGLLAAGGKDNRISLWDLYTKT